MKPLRSVLDSPLLAETTSLLPLLPVLIYQISYMNSFFPITEGWFTTYGALIREGAVPYRDFMLPIPPLYPLAIACIQSICGESLLPLHWVGLGITALIGVVLYCLLMELFARGVAGVAAAMGLLYYQSGNAFIGYDFTQVVTLWLLLAALTLVRSLHGIQNSSLTEGSLWMSFLAGIFLSLALLTKQSNAGVCTLFMGMAVMVVVTRLAGFRTLLRYLIRMAAGFALPIILVCLWLGMNGAVAAFVAQVLMEAPAAKGGLYTSLTQWMFGFFAGSYLPRSMSLAAVGVQAAACTVMLVAGIGGAMRLTGRSTGTGRQILLLRDEDAVLRNLYSLLLAATGAASLAIVLVIVRYADAAVYAPILPWGKAVYDQAILAAVNVYICGGLVALGIFLLAPTQYTAATFFLLAFGVGLTFGNGTSAGLSEISAFLGVALASAVLLRLGLPYVLPAFLPLIGLLVFACYLIETKYENPYHWWSIESADVRREQYRGGEGLLAGLSMPPEKYAAIQTIASAIAEHSAAGQKVYVFPHMPIFYRLADRPPFNGAVVSWFDWMSDGQALRLAQALQDTPPAVMVVAELPDGVFQAHEQLFRGWRSLGQRQILDAIDTLYQNGRIHKIAHVPELDGLHVIVYACPAEPAH